MGQHWWEGVRRVGGPVLVGGGEVSWWVNTGGRG